MRPRSRYAGRTSTSSPVPAGDHVDPGNLKRVRSALPSGYEVADLKGPISIAALWDSVRDGRLTRLDARCWPIPLRRTRPREDVRIRAGRHGIRDRLCCSGSRGSRYRSDGQLSPVGDGLQPTTASVELTAAPVIEGAATLAAALTARTAVESGMETDTEISTASAYLDGFVVTVALLTDPGSRHAPLEPHFVNDLLG